MYKKLMIFIIIIMFMTMFIISLIGVREYNSQCLIVSDKKTCEKLCGVKGTLIRSDGTYISEYSDLNGVVKFNNLKYLNNTVKLEFVSYKDTTVKFKIYREDTLKVFMNKYKNND